MLLLLRRLAILKFAENVTHIDSTTRQCFPVNVRKRALTLVWPAQAVQNQDEDPEDYSCTPLENVERLLADVSARESGDPMETDEFAWWLGGVVPGGSTKPIYRAIEAVDANVQRRLRHQTHINFIYDLVPMTTPLKDLHFVMDAGRLPLRSLAIEAFREAYGLDRTLAFKSAAPRDSKPSDIWATLY